jgi:hypothetical protein
VAQAVARGSIPRIVTTTAMATSITPAAMSSPLLAQRTMRMGGRQSAAHGEAGDAASNTARRYRVSQACEHCRLKKGKCDGRQPTCSVCKRHGIDCSYDPKPRKRGLRPGQYSTLERRAFLAELVAAVLVSKTPNAEELVRSFFSFQDGDLPFLAPEHNLAELEKLLDCWKESPVSQWLLQTSARTDPVLDQMSRMRSNQTSEVDGSTIMSSNEDRIIPDRYNSEYSGSLCIA